MTTHSFACSHPIGIVGLVLLLASSATAQSGPKFAKEYEALIERAVSVSPSGTGGAQIQITAGRAALIETRELICRLLIHDTDVPSRKRYEFRTFHKPTGFEVSGTGEVFEKYWSIAKPNEGPPNREDALVIDKGSVTVVDAGFLKIVWSAERWFH